MDKREFNLRNLGVIIDEVIDEPDGETVLTLVSHGERGVNGYLMLQVGEGLLRWQWQVNEPEAIATIAGAENLLWDAAKRLRTAMREMVEMINERDGS